MPSSSNTSPPESDCTWGTLRIPRGETPSGGFLTVIYLGARITVMFPASKVALLLLLNEELLADLKSEEPPEIRGWRSLEELLPLLDNPVQQVETLRRTIWAINSAFRTAAEQALPDARIPRLIETKRQIGVRLHWPLLLDYPDGRSMPGAVLLDPPGGLGSCA